MALMTAADRKRAALRFIKEHFVLSGRTATVDSDELLAAVDAADTWMEANTASFLAVLPAAFAAKASKADKAALIAYVALQRVG